MIQILKTKKNQIEKRKRYRKLAKTPWDLVKKLNRAKNCREVLQYHHVDSWIYDYMSYLGRCTSAGLEAMDYILYSLIFILDELKLAPFEERVKYVNDKDVLLEDVISIASQEHSWNLDKISALGLCAKIVEDYTFEIICKKGEDNADNKTVAEKGSLIYVDDEEDDSALIQIIRNYSPESINKTCDVMWEWFIDDLMVKHDENENILYDIYDMRDLERKVRKREIVPKCYDNVIW